jgi:hypothetical protein
MTLNLPRSAAGLALLAALAAGCSTAANAAHSAPKPASVAHHHGSGPAQRPATGPANPIPQGNGGDHDPDNNGGPSDGDGNL